MSLPDLQELRAALGDPVLDAELLGLALTHRSYAYENGGIPTNERMEFLGDSVLGLVVAEHLFRAHPDLPEGQLSKMRQFVVNETALAGVAEGIGLGAHVKLGKGEESSGGREKASILSDTVEAIIGATYLTAGFAEAAALIHHLFDGLLEDSAELGAGLDWKTSLQELVAERDLPHPHYVITHEGPDHERIFHARVQIGDDLYPAGVGRSKKVAEKQAAEHAYRALSADA